MISYKAIGTLISTIILGYVVLEGKSCLIFYSNIVIEFFKNKLKNVQNNYKSIIDLYSIIAFLVIASSYIVGTTCIKLLNIYYCKELQYLGYLITVILLLSHFKNENKLKKQIINENEYNKRFTILTLLLYPLLFVTFLYPNNLHINFRWVSCILIISINYSIIRITSIILKKHFYVLNNAHIKFIYFIFYIVINVILIYLFQYNYIYLLPISDKILYISYISFWILIISVAFGAYYRLFYKAKYRST